MAKTMQILDLSTLGLGPIEYVESSLAYCSFPVYSVPYGLHVAYIKYYDEHKLHNITAYCEIIPDNMLNLRECSEVAYLHFGHL